MCLYIFLLGFVHMSAVPVETRREHWILEVELEAVVSHLTSFLGTKLRSSARAVPTLNC